MTEEELAQQLKQYQQLAKDNKEVDIATLSLQALQGYERNMLDVKEKRWAYLVSIALPPLGLIFAAKFYFARKDDSTQAATICVVLTFLSILLTFLIFKVMLSNGPSLNQLEQTPQQYQQLLQ